MWKHTFVTRNLTDQSPAAADGTAGVDLEGLGTLRFVDGKFYKGVLHKRGSESSTDGVAGEVAYYHTLDGYKTNVVCSDLSDSIEIGAGVLQANMGDFVHGWIQIKGAATLSIALTAGADGDPLTPTGSDDDGKLDVSAAYPSIRSVNDLVINLVAPPISESSLLSVNE